MVLAPFNNGKYESLWLHDKSAGGIFSINCIDLYQLKIFEKSFPKSYIDNICVIKFNNIVKLRLKFLSETQ